MSGRPVQALIDLAAIAANWGEIKKRAPRRALAVIKADAYGHGALRIAAALDKVMAAADGFALTEIAAACALRRRGITRPILLLNGFFSPQEAAIAARENLWFAIHSSWQIAALSRLPADAGATVFVKCDTGMNRLGFAAAAAPRALAYLRMMPQVKDAVVMTHFAAGENPQTTRAQLRRLTPLRNASLSLANSALLFFHPQNDDDWPRIGVALYGASPAPQKAAAADLGLRPAMTLTTRLIAIRDLRRGDKVGYGGDFIADAPMRIGVAAAGYGDGYPRAAWNPAASNAGYAVIETHRGAAKAGLAGRVSMDLLALDLRAAPAAAVGDRVILWGASPAADEVAASAGTIGYELLTRVSARRVYR